MTLALDFLRQWEPTGPWLLTAIDPMRRGAIETRMFGPDQEQAANAWIIFWEGKRNLYFSTNRPRTPLPHKANKSDIIFALSLHVDVDPPKTIDASDQPAWIAERARILTALQTHQPSPSIIIDSGGGYQGFWRLSEPVEIDSPERAEEIEGFNKRLQNTLGGDHCFNIDRIMRLPGTTNLPDKKKAAKGRKPALASLVVADWGLSYKIEDFGPPPAPAAKPTTAPNELRRDPPEWCRRIVAHGPDREGPRAYGGDRSKAVLAVCCALVRSGFTDEETAVVINDPANAISEHVHAQSQPAKYAARQAARARELVGGDFELNTKGKPLANQRNIRLALAKLEVQLKYDNFSRRALIEGPEGEPQRFMDDDEVVNLYLSCDELFKLRAVKDYFFDTVKREARTHGFHPVLDYLAALRWDGQPRVDTWLHRYGGAEDTPYCRAIAALVLVAAVRRVREPGCKFDEMVVLESPQGLDKSNALATLAVERAWFTDSLPLNADDKKVIETLSGKWIVEIAELKGLHRSDVEHLKAFLSRNIDRARLSYARLPVEAPRQCVFFGTTNADTYLRDATGNRRFWPVRVSAFDVTALRADRDQLWAEAAAREAAGESIRLDPKLYPRAALEQERRLVDDPWVSVIGKELNGYDGGRILSADLWTVLSIPTGLRTQEHNARLGEAMRNLGWDRKKLRINGHPQWHYAKGSSEEQEIRIHIERAIDGTLQVYAEGERFRETDLSADDSLH